MIFFFLYVLFFCLFLCLFLCLSNASLGELSIPCLESGWNESKPSAPMAVGLGWGCKSQVEAAEMVVVSNIWVMTGENMVILGLRLGIGLRESLEPPLQWGWKGVPKRIPQQNISRAFVTLTLTSDLWSGKEGGTRCPATPLHPAMSSILPWQNASEVASSLPPALASTWCAEMESFPGHLPSVLFKDWLPTKYILFNAWPTASAGSVCWTKYAAWK